MTTYAWPATRAFIPREATLRQIDNLQRETESPLSGYTQTLVMPGAKWGWAFDFSAQSLDARAELEAYLTRLSGRQHRVLLWDMKQPRPRGTCNLSGVTLGASAALFATSLSLAGCGANRTLLAGDWLGLPTGQLVRVVAGATANGSGVMTVEVRHMLRASLASGAAVTLDKPTATFIAADSNLSLPRTSGRAAPPLSIEFVEVFA